MFSSMYQKQYKQQAKQIKMSSMNTTAPTTPVPNPVALVNWGDLGPPPPPPVLIRQTAIDLRVIDMVRRRLEYESDDEDEN